MTTTGATPQLRPLGIGEILDVCINIFTKNFLTFLRIVLVVVIPVQLITVLIQVATVSNANLVPKFGSTGANTTLTGDEQTAFLGGQIVIVILALILNGIATAACFKAVGDAYLGSKPDWRSSLKFAGRRFHSVIWVTFLVGLTSTLGLILLIVPGVWLWVSFAVAVPVLLFEGVKGTGAMSRSRQLVKGRWWATAGAVVSAYLISTIVGGILQSLISALVFTDAGKSVFGVAAVNAVAAGVGQLVSTPFLAAVAAVVYYDLRVRKEGFDLQLLAEKLGVAAPPSAAAPPTAFPADSSVPVWERQGGGDGAPPPPPPPPAPGG
jgi:hypothetical protein